MPIDNYAAAAITWRKFVKLIVGFLLSVIAFQAAADQPNYIPQTDNRIKSGMFVSQSRGFYVQFFPHGMYKFIKTSNGEEIGSGAYNTYGNVLVFDPGTPKKMTCEYEPRAKALILRQCPYEETWQSLF